VKKPNDISVSSGALLFRLDPRTKLLLALIFSLVIFLLESLYLSALFAFFLLVIGLSSGIPIKKIFPHAKLLLFLVIFVIVLQLLFGQDKYGYFLKPLIPANVPLIGGYGSLKKAGLFTGLMLGFRITALYIMMPLLIITTDTRLLAYGITRFGINYKGAFIITSALNIVPMFENEANAIIDARKLRGMEFPDKGNIFIKLREYAAIVIPLIIKTMRHGNEMGLVMDSRAFGAYKTRIWSAQTKFTPADYFVLFLGITLSAAFTALEFIGRR